MTPQQRSIRHNKSPQVFATYPVLPSSVLPCIPSYFNLMSRFLGGVSECHVEFGLTGLATFGFPRGGGGGLLFGDGLCRRSHLASHVGCVGTPKAPQAVSETIKSNASPGKEEDKIVPSIFYPGCCWERSASIELRLMECCRN